MESMPTHQYVEIRNGAYYVAGTRIGLDVIVHEFRDGHSAEAIFDAYPLIGPWPTCMGPSRSYSNTRMR